MARGLQNGLHRDAFTARLADEVELRRGRLEELSELASPTQHWREIISLLKAAAQPFYGAVSPDRAEVRDFRRARRELLRERAGLRLRLRKEGGELSQLLAVEARLGSVSHRLVQLVRARRRSLRALWASDLAAAWRARDFSLAHRLAHMLVGRGTGPRRRRFWAPLARQLDSAAWAQKVAKAAPLGCMEAERVVLVEQEVLHTSFAEELGQLTLGHLEGARQDVEGIVPILKRMPALRAVPHWSLPRELFLMAIGPELVTVRRTAAPALGAPPPAGPEARAAIASLFQGRMGIFTHCRRARFLPIDSMRPMCWPLPKGDGGLRLPALARVAPSPLLAAHRRLRPT